MLKYKAQVEHLRQRDIMEEETKIRLKDRFARWQSKTNQQFGYFNNLLIFLSVGTIAFVANQLSKNEFVINNCWSKVFYGLGTILIIISIITGTYLGYNRLRDFRKTTAKILARIENDNNELKLLKKQTKYLGELSWNLLVIQFISLLLGELLIIFSLGLMFGYKLL